MTATRRNRIVSYVFRAVLVIVFLAIGGGVMEYLKQTKPEPAESEGGAAARRVLVMQSAPVEVGRVWDGYGTAEAMDTADVPARVTATVLDVPLRIEPGTWVEVDDVLATLDATDFERQVEITTQRIADLDAQIDRLGVERKSWTERLELAEEFVDLARANYERVERVISGNAGNQNELDRARQALIQAIRDEVAAREEFDKLDPRSTSLSSMKLAEEAALRLAELNVERCTITSPIAGVVQSIDVDEGESLQPGQRVARVVGLERIVVPLRLPSSARPDVAVGDDVTLRSTGATPREWRADVVRIAPEDDPGSRTMAVYVEHRQEPTAPDMLPPGQFVRGLVRSKSEQRRTVVPRRAVQDGRMWLVDDGVLVSREARIDYSVERRFEAFGLNDTQWLVIHGLIDSGSFVVVNASRSFADGLPASAVLPGDEEVAAGSGAQASLP